MSEIDEHRALLHNLVTSQSFVIGKKAEGICDVFILPQ